MLKNIRSFFYKYKKYQQPLEKYLFPVVLILYPLIGVNAGVDITDTTYSLANYEFIGSIDPMWLLSTFISNIVGNGIMKLPGAGTMLGFGIYCSLIISIIAIISYYSLKEYMPGWMIFIGIIISESLCWCPRVILYNYLTYLFMTAGILLLLKGIFSWKRQTLYLFCAGLVLGLNVMVRFPNVTETAFILILWFYSFLTKENLMQAVKKTIVCICGYLVGFGIPFAAISFIYGKNAYFDMIGSLFGMTSKASDYTAGGMLSVIIETYVDTGSKMLIFIPCIAAGMIMFSLYENKYISVKKVLYVMGLMVLIKFFFSRGILTRNYYYYDSIFQIAMMLVILSLIIAVIGSTGFLNGSRQEQTLSFTIIIIVLITPLGSNNYTFPVLNNLFVVLPLALWLFRRLMQRLGDRSINFPWQSMITVVIAITLIQGALFHMNFSFVDGADGAKRDSVSTSVEKIKYMVTTEENVRSLEELNDYLISENKIGSKALLFGQVPGLAYIFDLKPAIDTVWPDLDSYTAERFAERLEEISESDEPEVMIICGKNIPEYSNIEAKYDILLDYIANRDYNIDFESDKFIVYTVGK